MRLCACNGHNCSRCYAHPVLLCDSIILGFLNLTGIIDNANDSLFSYNESLGESWAYFYDPDYTPAFAPTFDDPDLEAEAIEICGDSAFCLFDIAATKRPEIGMTTAVNNQDL